MQFNIMPRMRIMNKAVVWLYVVDGVVDINIYC